MSNIKVKPMWHVYVRKATAFVPIVAKTQAGFFLDVEPVRIAKLDDIPLLSAAIGQAMEHGNPAVPTPPRSAFPKPVILKPAGVKTWNAFVDQGACFTIFRTEMGSVEVVETGRNDDGEWIDAPSINLPAGSLPSDISKYVSERVAQRPDLK